jgi:tetratricopeptide (TPR) repeat protein
LFKEYPASPTTQRVWVAVADTLYEQQKFAQAAALYQKFADKLDDAAKTRFQLANAIATSGGNTSALLSVANQVLEDDKPKMAQRLYKLILEGNPPQATKDEARVRLGWCLYLQDGKENYARAGELWQQVSQESAASEKWQIEAEWHLVQLASGPQGDWKKAVQLCDQISRKRAPGTFAQEQALFVKAWLLLVEKQWWPTKNSRKSILKQTPTCPTGATSRWLGRDLPRQREAPPQPLLHEDPASPSTAWNDD